MTISKLHKNILRGGAVGAGNEEEVNNRPPETDRCPPPFSFIGQC